jgi:capsule polysaccharide export protein KpsE/RkpR
MRDFDWATPTSSMIQEEIDEARMRIAVLRVRLAECDAKSSVEDNGDNTGLTLRLSTLQDHLATALAELDQLESYRSSY